MRSETSNTSGKCVSSVKYFKYLLSSLFLLVRWSWIEAGLNVIRFSKWLIPVKSFRISTCERAESWMLDWNLFRDPFVVGCEVGWWRILISIIWTWSRRVEASRRTGRPKRTKGTFLTNSKELWASDQVFWGPESKVNSKGMLILAEWQVLLFSFFDASPHFRSLTRVSDSIATKYKLNLHTSKNLC